jgi:hypothetical protein
LTNITIKTNGSIRRKLMKFTTLMATLLISLECTSAQPQTKANPETPQGVTFCQVANARSSFVGKRIRVRAIYSYMFEVSVLKPTKCCEGENHTIWVDFAENMDSRSAKLVHQFPEGMGVVLATFEGTIQYVGNTNGEYRLLVDGVKNVERKKKTSHAIPAWVPRCEK